MGALITPLFTLYNPSVALWLRVGVRVRPCHGVWWVSASMSNVARMHTTEVPWALSMLLCTCTLAIRDAHGTSIVCILATLLKGAIMSLLLYNK